VVVDYLHKLLASKILTGHGSHEDAECVIALRHKSNSRLRLSASPSFAVSFSV